MKKALLILPLLVFILFSCSPRMNPGLLEEPQDVYIGSTDSTTFNLEMLFVAATPEYLIFEAEFINQSPEEMLLKREDFELQIPERALKSAPYSTDDLMEFLLLERKAAKKAKRNRTIQNGVSLGFGLLTGVFGGWSAFNVVSVSLEDLIYLGGDRRIMNREIKSIEGEMDYLREVNLDSVLVAPMDTIYREIFFPFDFTSEDVEVIYRRDSTNYSMILTPEDLRLR